MIFFFQPDMASPSSQNPDLASSGMEDADGSEAIEDMPVESPDVTENGDLPQNPQVVSGLVLLVYTT